MLIDRAEARISEAGLSFLSFGSVAAETARAAQDRPVDRATKPKTPGNVFVTSARLTLKEVREVVVAGQYTIGV